MAGPRSMRIVGAALLSAVLLAGLSGSVVLGQSAVIGSPHDLSGAKATGEIEICAFCHLPVKNGDSDRPAWMHAVPAPDGFAAYAVPAANEHPVTQPHGISLVCLSCHDSIIAIDVGFATAVSGGVPGVAPTAGGLMAGHPISISYYQGYDPRLKRPNHGRAGDLPLYRDSGSTDGGERVECPSCHNPHEIVFGKFLRVSNGDALCRNCHKL